jgi:hypothetical protein
MKAAQAAGDTSLYVNTKMDTSTYDAFNKQKLAVLGLKLRTLCSSLIAIAVTTSRQQLQVLHFRTS